MHVKDFIVIENFSVPARVGHTVAERSFPQIIRLDIHIYLPLYMAAKRDRMDAALDYASVITKTERLLARKKFVLIETLAEAVAKLILGHPLAEAVSVKATKHVFSNVQAVGAHIWREK
jgi:FolB domain-containing protein